MNEVTSTIRIHYDGYCSQARKPLPLIRSVNDGVAIIEKILKKEILCRHDVEDINKAYQAIDNLEKRLDHIPEVCSSIHALAKIIEKIKYIAEYTINSRSLISLYHLQNFSEKGCGIDICFKRILNKVKTGLLVTEIATHLPYCESEEKFNADVKSLIDYFPHSNEATQILNQKRKKLQSHENLKKTIVDEKIKLAELREKDPQKYPAYLDELLDNGYIHLYDHHIKMSAISSHVERQSEIEKMTFSQLSHVALEMREAIIGKVESSIPLEMREAIIRKVESSIPANHHNILFLLGDSGKSTALSFFRGDVNKPKSDTSSLIGDQGAASCTFLPIVEIVNNLVIVDFPSFDSFGQIISMGIKFALQALIEKYYSNILVFHAITNIGDEYKAAGQLGMLLNRLFKNKGNCRLGITQYHNDSNFVKILGIEEQQKIAEMLKLEGKIELLSESNDSELRLKKEKLENELAELRLEQSTKKRILPETEEKKKHRNILQEKESKISKQIGLKNVIRFCDLEDPQYLFKCFKTLSQIPKDEFICVNSDHHLDPNDKELLEDRFINDLIKEMNAKKNYPVDFRDFQIFVHNVLESSLINAIFLQSNPEIGEFLHLPEIDHKIVRNYGKIIIRNFIKEHMKAIISTLNKSYFDKVLDEMGKMLETDKTQDSVEKINELRGKWEGLKKYIVGLLGHYSLFEDSQQAKKLWNDIGEQNKLTIIERCCHTLNQSQEMLMRLKDMKKIIKKQDSIEEAIKSTPICMDSFNDLKESIRKRINQVRSVYGSTSWDERVAFLAKQFSLNGFDSSHDNCVLAYAYYLIEPDLKGTFSISDVDNGFLHLVANGVVEAFSRSINKLIVGNNIGNDSIYTKDKNKSWYMIFAGKEKEIELEKEFPKPLIKNEKIEARAIRISGYDMPPTFINDLEKISPGLHPLTNTLFAAAILFKVSHLT